MALTVNTNISALNAYRNLTSTQGDMQKSLQRLSSGLRINSAADDAAGLAISEGIRAQVGGLKVAARNAQDGISVVQTAEGALNQVHSVLQRLRDLAVQGANDSNSAQARDAIQLEASQLTEELGRIATSTEFNGKKLLDGSTTGANALNFQVGAYGDSASRIKVDLAGADVSEIASGLDFGNTQVKAVSATSAAVAGAANGNWTFTQGGVEVTVNGVASTDRANAGALASKLNGDSGFSSNFNASVDNSGNLLVTSKSTSTSAIVINDGTAAVTTTAADKTIGFDSHDEAQAAIGVIDGYISSVSSARATLGAVQNRFDYAIDNINVATENLSASESRIRDTDMALEMSNYTRAQILQQAGTAMLAQANQAPQAVLQLLQG